MVLGDGDVHAITIHDSVGIQPPRHIRFTVPYYPSSRQCFTFRKLSSRSRLYLVIR